MDEGPHPCIVFLPSQRKIRVLSTRFALLLSREEESANKEKAEIFLSLLREYVGQAKDVSKRFGTEKEILEKVFEEEMQ